MEIKKIHQYYTMALEGEILRFDFPELSTLSVNRNLSLLQSDIHWNPLHQNFSYLDTDYVNLSLISI